MPHRTPILPPVLSPSGKYIGCPGCGQSIELRVPVTKETLMEKGQIGKHSIPSSDVVRCLGSGKLVSELWPAESDYKRPVVDVTAAELLSNIGVLLDNLAGAFVPCRRCGADVWWVTHRTGKRAPYERTGANHLSKCRPE